MSTRRIQNRITRMLIGLILINLFFLFLHQNSSAGQIRFEKVYKPRVLILTDIENEPDDAMSMVRFMTYTNEFDVEGLIATTSTWQRNKIADWRIQEIVEAYGKVRENLLKHKKGYPTKKYLLGHIKRGYPDFGMKAVGEGKDSEGSDWIIKVVDRPDLRPVWILVWGGPNCLAQALWKVKNTRSQEELDRFVSKIRVYTISDQDDSGPWIRETFPNLFYIVSPGFEENGGGAYHYATWVGISGDRFHGRFQGADFSLVDNPWLEKNIIKNHGPLGAMYPRVKYLMEGDTPTFLYLIPNGLCHPEHPNYGSWGGRYELGIPMKRRWHYEQETRPIWTDAMDEVRGVDGKWYTSNQATIWRWRKAYQHDFAARIDWSATEEYEQANHNPVAAFRNDKSKAIVHLSVKSGEVVELNAVGTYDPDSDSISYRWFIYPEVGSCYVGHGETYQHPQDLLWWTKGGVLWGQSPPRIAFFKEFMMSGPLFEEMQPLGDDRGHYILGIPGEYYLVYFDVPKTITVDLAGNRPYKIDVIDPWEMKETPQGTARPGQYTFSAPRADMLYRFTTGQYVKQWDVFELELSGPSTGNPFKDVTISAQFTHGDTTIEVRGFYDGDGIYRIRFMPHEQGPWTYMTSSNVAELDSITGSFFVIGPSPDNHGPVRVVDWHHFAYADGKRFFPVGTTLYCWELERYDETLNTLANSAINKVRFMPFPHGGNQLPISPFKGSPNNWDFSQPNPYFWQRIDRSITDLAKLGIEADFIFFHPYDRGQWGLDKMSKEQKEFYLRYVTARLAAYHNVWWSMANEYDLINKSTDYWDNLAKVVADTDPFEHMHSIHGLPNSEFPWGSSTWCTHVSIQTPTVTKISSLMSRYKKPVIVDEYQYEGNVEGWGNLSGYEETRRHWIATIRGGYATHGEAYSPYNFFWKGGTPQGDSFFRISWLSQEVLNNELKPLPGGLVNMNSVSAHVGEDYYLYYYGSTVTSGKTYSVPAGKQYNVDVLDTWNMTVAEKGIYSDTFTINWPPSQYIAVRIYNADLVSAIEEPEKEKALPTEFSLSANYPNPFNPVTMISYTLPKAVHVNMDIFDVLGRKVATLVNGMKSAGRYEAVFNGINLASGIYFYRLRAGSYYAQKRMLLLK